VPDADGTVAHTVVIKTVCCAWGRLWHAHTMVQRGRHACVDPLATCGQSRWLVVRDRQSRPLEYKQLGPRADLRAAMLAKRAELVALGWLAAQLKANRGFFFCERENERICVSVESYEPGHALYGYRP
jgi:hypothetical protein